MNKIRFISVHLIWLLWISITVMIAVTITRWSEARNIDDRKLRIELFNKLAGPFIRQEVIYHKDLSEAYYLVGLLDSSLCHLEIATTLQLNPNYIVNLGDYTIMQGDTMKAMEYYIKASYILPNNHGLHLKMLRLYPIVYSVDVGCEKALKLVDKIGKLDVETFYSRALLVQLRNYAIKCKS